MLIENTDKNKFEQALRHYGVDYEGGSLSSTVLNDMLERHAKNKEHIYELFGEKLRMEREIETTVTKEEANNIKEKLIDALVGPQYIFVRSLLRELTAKEFIANTLDVDINVYGAKIQKGLKLSKALTRLCLPKYAHEVSTAHSMANQKLFTKGKVVISIDPIDYITMSSNASGWKSCHRLNGGEYRTGPLAYLVDTSSVICYIESKNQCTFMRGGEKFQHSNKSWRQIALVNPSCEYVIQERQYPDRNTLNENAVSQLFADVLNDFHKTDGYKYKNTKCEVLNNLHIDYAAYHDIYSLYYNDIVNEMFSFANVVYNFSTFKRPEDIVLRQPVKGEGVKCLACGEYLDEPESLYCCDCHDEDEY